MNEARVAILLSGNGSNAENLIHRLHNTEVRISGRAFLLKVAVVLSNQKEAYGLKRVEKVNQSIKAQASNPIAIKILEHRLFATRLDFDRALIKTLDAYHPHLVVLAGFMRILSAEFIHHFKTINIHPSLLPKYKGAHAIRQSYESQDEEVGVSVHWVSEDLDGGEIIAQGVRKRAEAEDFASFEQELHKLEYAIYPQSVLMALEKILPHSKDLAHHR